MTLDIGSLQRIKRRGVKKQSVKWEQIKFGDLHTGTYLACDPSLAGFGLVLFEVSANGAPVVHMAQQFVTTQTEFGGWEDVLQRSAILANLVSDYCNRWILDEDWGEVFAVHEAPPVGGLKHSHFEISLLTGHVFRQCIGLTKLLPMVRRQDHCMAVCGDPNAKKEVHHAALKELFPQIRGAELITNSGTRDALSVALLAARRGH